MDVKRCIDKTVAIVVENIKAQAEEVDDDFKKIEDVARISANNDEKIGQGRDKAMEFLKAHPEVFEEVDAKIREKYEMQ